MDGSGNLYVADESNSRVLEYNTPLALMRLRGARHHRRYSVRARRQLYFEDFNNGGVSANSLSFPTSVAVDSSGDLYIADAANSRVLEYNTPLAVTSIPGSGDTTADVVFGQGGDFTTITANGITADTLSDPFGVAVDGGGNLYVADQGNRYWPNFGLSGRF